MLLNHFKSKGYGAQSTSDDKRKRQADRVVEILQGYDLKKDLVIVCGDFNDTPDSNPLKSLLSVSDLHDVLRATFSNPADRWTYHYKKNEQIDYMLVSKPLRDGLQTAGVERRGIFDVDKYTNAAIHAFNSVKQSKDSADHGALWADFTI